MSRRAVIVQIAQALTDALRAKTFAQPCLVERAYDPEIDLEGLEARDKATLTVVPAGLKTEWETRADQDKEITIHVAVRKKLSASPEERLAECDALVLLAEEIQRALVGEGPKGLNHLATEPDAVCTEAQVDLLWSPRQMRENGVFFALIVATYQLVEEV